MLSGTDTFITAETGSGKTLAYVLPALQQYLYGPKSSQHPEPGLAFPFLIIVAPTRELCTQIGNVIHAVTSEQDVAVCVLLREEVWCKRHVPAVMVTTPHCLLHNLDVWSANHHLPTAVQALKCVVFDEADFTFSSEERVAQRIVRTIRGFSKKSVAASARSHMPFDRSSAVSTTAAAAHGDRPLCQMILVGATLPEKLPQSVGSKMRLLFPTATTVSTDLLHKRKPHIHETFIEIPAAPVLPKSTNAMRIAVLREKFRQKLQAGGLDLQSAGNGSLPSHAQHDEYDRSDHSNLSPRPLDDGNSTDAGSVTDQAYEDHTGSIVSSSPSAAALTVEANTGTITALVKDLPSAMLNEDEARRIDQQRWSALANVLVKTLKQRPSDRILVFVNSTVSADDTARYLAAQPDLRDSVDVLHALIPAAERAQVLERFSRSECKILISTDLAARGIDFGGGVEHVVQFEFPPNVISYLHRVGRTARVDRPGQGNASFHVLYTLHVGSSFF